DAGARAGAGSRRTVRTNAHRRTGPRSGAGDVFAGVAALADKVLDRVRPDAEVTCDRLHRLSVVHHADGLAPLLDGQLRRVRIGRLRRSTSWSRQRLRRSVDGSRCDRSGRTVLASGRTEAPAPSGDVRQIAITPEARWQVERRLGHREPRRARRPPTIA